MRTIDLLGVVAAMGAALMGFSCGDDGNGGAGGSAGDGGTGGEGLGGPTTTSTTTTAASGCCFFQCNDGVLGNASGATAETCDDAGDFEAECSSGAQQFEFVGGCSDCMTCTPSWYVEDVSTSCADAVPLQQKDNSLGGIFFDYDAVIGAPGDIDYFTFQATAGDWIRVKGDTESGSEVNTVVTLYNADGSIQVAENNNPVGSSSDDGELAYRVIETGTYCLEVQDRSTWLGNDPAGGPGYAYRALMVPIDYVPYDYYNFDTEPNDSTTASQTGLSFSTNNDLQISTAIAGLFDDASDIDVYEWTAPTGALAFSLYFTPPGSDGYGSTQDPGIIRVYEADGSTVLAELDVQKGADRFSSVPVTAGNTYYIEVNAPVAFSPGANDFYYLIFNTTLSLNQQEADDTTNNTSAGAEVAPPQADGTTMRHYVGGTLTAGDDDWWHFQAPTGADIVLACSSWRAGSGVRDATFTIHDDPGAAHLQTETETEDADIYWSSNSSASMGAVPATTTGTHYLRISATTLDASVTSSHYLCGIHVYP